MKLAEEFLEDSAVKSFLTWKDLLVTGFRASLLLETKGSRLQHVFIILEAASSEFTVGMTS